MDQADSMALKRFSGIGFIASLWVHLRAIFGWVVAAESWSSILNLRTFPAMFAMFLAVFIANRSIKGAKDKLDMKMLWNGAPPWVRDVAKGLTLYVIVDLIVVFLTSLPGEHAITTPAEWRFFSALCMDIYYMVSVVLYSVAGGRQNYIIPSHAAEER